MENLETQHQMTWKPEYNGENFCCVLPFLVVLAVTKIEFMGLESSPTVTKKSLKKNITEI